MFSYFGPNFIEKFLWESVFFFFLFLFLFFFFQILAKIKMTQNKNWLFGLHFETKQHFEFSFPELWFLIVYAYMVQISLQNSGGKMIFLGEGSMEPPLGTNGSKSTLGVNDL